MPQLEEYVPALKYGATVSIDQAGDFNGTLNADGATTLGSTLAVTGVSTFTGAIIRSGGETTPMVSVPDGAAYSVLTANSGKLHLILNQAQDATLTLPTAAAGLHYKFVSTMVAADGHDWIFDTGSDTNFFLGGLVFMDSDVGGAASEVILAAGDGDSNSKLQVNLPSAGTSIEMYCDGTNWFLSGFVFSTTAPAYSDQQGQAMARCKDCPWKLGLRDSTTLCETCEGSGQATESKPKKASVSKPKPVAKNLVKKKARGK